MPATTLVCPHCEKTVEIQVSSVTRSRTCPECGEIVMLQMAEKSTKTKRRALLMGQGSAPADEEESENSAPAGIRGMEPPHEPQPLLGDAFERMRKDPEVREARRTLLIGSGVVIAIIVVLVVANMWQSGREEDVRKEFFDDVSAADSAGKRENTEPPVSREDLQIPADPNSLVFRPPGQKQMRAGAAAPAQDTNAALSTLAGGQAAVEKFLAAATWKERLLFVRNPDRVEALMQSFYERNADGPTSFDSLVEATELPFGFTQHTVVFAGGGRRVATVEHNAEGARVDWEAFVGAGQMPWADFISERQTQPAMFRVLVSPAGHYEHGFGDPSALKCYSLRNISEPGAKVLYGYLDRRSAMAREIDFWLEKDGDDSVPMILSLKFPLDAPADFQVWIHHFIQSGWVLR